MQKILAQLFVYCYIQICILFPYPDIQIPCYPFVSSYIQQEFTQLFEKESNMSD